MAQILSHSTIHCGPRSKPSLIEHACKIVMDVYSKKPQLVVKHMLPVRERDTPFAMLFELSVLTPRLSCVLQVAFSLLNEKSTATRMAIQKLVHVLNRVMGSSFLDHTAHLSPTLQSRVHDMLTSNYL